MRRGAGRQEPGEIAGDNVGVFLAGKQANTGLGECAGDEFAAGEASGRGVVQMQVDEDVFQGDHKNIPAIIPAADLCFRPGQRFASLALGTRQNRAEMRSFRPAQVTRNDTLRAGFRHLVIPGINRHMVELRAREKRNQAVSASRMGEQ
jgi:hypothetical protein